MAATFDRRCNHIVTGLNGSHGFVYACNRYLLADRFLYSPKAREIRGICEIVLIRDSKFFHAEDAEKREEYRKHHFYPALFAVSSLCLFGVK